MAVKVVAEYHAVQQRTDLGHTVATLAAVILIVGKEYVEYIIGTRKLCDLLSFVVLYKSFFCAALPVTYTTDAGKRKRL